MSRFSSVRGALAVVLFPIGLAAQSAWSRVPTLPTNCYQKQDQFFDQADKAWVDLGHAEEEQRGVNLALGHQLTVMDPATKQSRMMAFLQKDPAKAAALMQQGSSDAAQLPERQKAAENKKKDLQGRVDALKKQYADESAPLIALRLRIDAAAEDAMNHGAGVEQRRNVIAPLVAQYNGAYERICAKWWSATTSPFVSYLNDFKQYEVELNIPLGDWVAKQEKDQLDLYGVPTTTYKSTAEMLAVREYLQEARTIYGLRLNEARAP
jgi:hypothetical protein